MNANDGEMPIGSMSTQDQGDMPSGDMNAPVPPGAEVEGEMPAGTMSGEVAQGMPMGAMLASAIAAAGMQPDGMPGNPCGCG